MGKDGSYSHSEIDMFRECPMRWQLAYREGIRAPSVGALEKGTVVHQLAEEFDKNHDVKYSSADEFSDYAIRRWWRHTIMIEEGEKKKGLERVIWKEDNEKGMIAGQIGIIAKPMYELMNSLETPEFREMWFKVDLIGIGHERRNFGLKGSIDAIRLRDGKVIINDYKTGWPPPDVKVHYGTQPTMYVLGTLLAADYEDTIRKTFGWTKKQINDMLNDNEALREHIEFEYLNLENRTLELDERGRPVINPRTGRYSYPLDVLRVSTNRIDSHFHDLVRTIRKMQQAEDNPIVIPGLGKYACKNCRWLEPCIERAMKVGDFEGEQKKFSFADVPYRIQRIRFKDAKKGNIENLLQLELQKHLDIFIEGKPKKEKKILTVRFISKI